MNITPYLFFDGRAEEAAHFYAGVFGGKVENLFHYNEMPATDGNEDPARFGDKVGHCCVIFPGGSMSMADCKDLMARAGAAAVSGCGKAISEAAEPQSGDGENRHVLTINCDSTAQAETLYGKLAEGARKIAFPLGEVYFATRYAELTDKFGIYWAIMFYEE